MATFELQLHAFTQHFERLFKQRNDEIIDRLERITNWKKKNEIFSPSSNTIPLRTEEECSNNGEMVSKVEEEIKSEEESNTTQEDQSEGGEITPHDVDSLVVCRTFNVQAKEEDVEAQPKPKMDEQVILPITIGDCVDKSLCEIVPMEVAHILIGSPLKSNHNLFHHEYTYHNKKKCTLAQLSTCPDFSEQKKKKRRSRAAMLYLLLFDKGVVARSRIIVRILFLLLFDKGGELDSRSNRFQEGGNDMNLPVALQQVCNTP